MSQNLNRAARAHLLRLTRAAVIRRAMSSPHYRELERLGGPRYWDRRGEPMSFVDWIVAVETGSRFVKQTTLGNGLWVSTIWLGMDHGWGQSKPVIFETMVFPGKGDLRDLTCRRYTSELAARTGHLELCQEWASKEVPEGGWT